MDIGTLWAATAIPLLILVGPDCGSEPRIGQDDLHQQGTCEPCSIRRDCQDGYLADLHGACPHQPCPVLEPLRIPCGLRYRDGTRHGDREPHLDRVHDRPAHHPRRPAGPHVPALHAGIWHDPDRRHRQFLRHRQYHLHDRPEKGTSQLLASSPGNTRTFSTPSRMSGISRTGRESSIRIQSAVS